MMKWGAQSHAAADDDAGLRQRSFPRSDRQGKGQSEVALPAWRKEKHKLQFCACIYLVHSSTKPHFQSRVSNFPDSHSIFPSTTPPAITHCSERDPPKMAAPPTNQSASNGNMIENTPPTTNGATAETTFVAPGLSADDFALYDRQIRLWGAQAQERIRNAHILLVSLRALGTEVAKNLTLAGISSLTIVDDEPVTEEDLGSCYFLRDEDIGKSVCALQREAK